MVFAVLSGAHMDLGKTKPTILEEYDDECGN
jgi:hypothetical protein